MSEDLKPCPRFGDIIENGWASEGNPTRVGFFVRAGKRTGRLNAGSYYEVTDGAGKFWELPSYGDHKITVRPQAALGAATARSTGDGDKGPGTPPDTSWNMSEETERDRASFIAQGRKHQAARLAGDTFTDWLLALAKIAEPEDPAAWLIGSVVLNEECWFDYFADGYTPASCWAEECSYD